MAMARGAASAWGIATGGESSYDAGDAITHLLYPVGAAQSAQNGDGYDFAQLATGFEESISFPPLRYLTQVTFTGPAMDTTLPILAAFALGTDTQTSLGSVTSAQHKIQPAGIAVELPSTTVQVASVNASSVTTNESIVHRGCVADTFTFSGDVGSGVCSVSTLFRASGTVSDTPADISSATRPTQIFSFNEVYCAMHKAANTIASGYTIKLPTDSAPAPDFSEFTTHYTNISPYIQGFSWTVNNALDVVGGHNTGSTLVAKTMYRQQRNQEISLTLRWSGEAAAVGGGGSAQLIRDLRANVFEVYSLALYGVTRTVIDAAEATDYRYAWTLIQPSVQLIEVTPIVNIGIQTITARFKVLEPNSGTLKSSDFYVWNKNRVDYA
jgi:hypothetical protein